MGQGKFSLFWGVKKCPIITQYCGLLCVWIYLFHFLIFKQYMTFKSRVVLVVWQLVSAPPMWIMDLGWMVQGMLSNWFSCDTSWGDPPPPPLPPPHPMPNSQQHYSIKAFFTVKYDIPALHDCQRTKFYKRNRDPLTCRIESVYTSEWKVWIVAVAKGVRKFSAIKSYKWDRLTFPLKTYSGWQFSPIDDDHVGNFGFGQRPKPTTNNNHLNSPDFITFMHWFCAVTHLRDDINGNSLPILVKKQMNKSCSSK